MKITLKDQKMGADAPYPIYDKCRRPEGCPAAALISGFPGTGNCPAVPREGP